MPTGDRRKTESARDLRQRQTPAERRLWDLVRSRRFAGMKVRRQHPVGPYVVDFCIERLLLVIELDGEIHREIPEHDAVRDAWLRSAGFTVLRIPNDEVFRDPAAVLKRIAETAAECAISHDDRAERSGSDSRA